MKLIVGLGNPEPKYALTRHNAGYWVVNEIATKYGGTFQESKDLHSFVSKVHVNGEAVVLAKPTTYMNLSGRAVQAILHWYKIAVEDCLVIHDDVSIPFGRVRHQKGGGAGGQHGVENTIQMLGGNKDFSRLKFGVGPDPGGDRRADYVLSVIPAEDMVLRDKVISLCVDSSSLWAKEGIDAASNKFNGLDLRPPPPPPPPPPVAVAPEVNDSDSPTS